MMKVGAVVLALALMASPARSNIRDCAIGNGCRSLEGDIYVNYALPDDGIQRTWTLTADDPAALVTVSESFQVDGLALYKTATGIDAQIFDFDFTFEQTTLPGITTIKVLAPKSFDNCGNALVGELCGRLYYVFGNPGRIIVQSSREFVFVRFAEAVSAVPEPQTWAMVITGFGALGAFARRRGRYLHAGASAS